MKMVQAPHPSSGHYSAAVISRGMLYISGQTSADPFTGEVPEGIRVEMQMCMERMEHILAAAGIDREHVVQCRIFLTDIGAWAEANQVYAEYFGVHRPARAVYGVSELHHGAHIELEAVAEMEESVVSEI